MRKKPLILCGGLLATLLLTTGCPDSGKKQGPAPASAGKGAAKTTVSATQVDLTPDNTKIEFTGTKPKGKHDGGFKEFTGSISNPATDLKGSAVKLEVETDSLYTDTPDVTKHLKTADFFNVKVNPRATFASTKIDAGPTIVGDLTLNGVTKEISFPATVQFDGKTFKLDSTFTINRLDFNMMYQPAAVDNSVTVRVKVDAQ